MKKNILLAIVVALIVASIIYLQRPEVIVDEQSGEEVVLGPIGEKVAVTVGNSAQDFLLTDYEGNQHRLSDYNGKPVMLNFWATWCPFCVGEMPLFQEVLPDYPELEIVAVNRGESLEDAKEFTDPMGLTYKLLLNSADDVAKAYQVQAMPTTLFIDEDGVIQEVKFGPIEEEELREKLDALMNVEYEEDVEEPVVNEAEVMMSSRAISVTDGVKHTVALSDIKGGGPPKDGIPSIDNPKFESVEDADEYLRDEGIGVAVSLNGVDRFYPNQITVYHEIVNDQIGDQAVLVTYCPLCGTGIVFDPIVNGKAVEFGTSGKLWNSNLVMYDRETDTYWSQVLGEAIVGELAGQKLALFPYDNVKWGDWKAAHPDGEVLSRNTGEFRDYTESPYGDYDFNDLVFFPVDNEDDRYHEKEPTFGIEFDGQFKVYPQSELRDGPGKFDDSFAGVALEVNFDKSDNTIEIRRKDTGEEVVPVYGFWFSWIAVHPDSEVYTAN